MKSRGGKNFPVSASGVSELLELVGYIVPIRITSGWDQPTRKEVATWAYANYLGVNNTIIKIPERPKILNELN